MWELAGLRGLKCFEGAGAKAGLSLTRCTEDFEGAGPKAGLALTRCAEDFEAIAVDLTGVLLYNVAAFFCDTDVVPTDTLLNSSLMSEFGEAFSSFRLQSSQCQSSG